MPDANGNIKGISVPAVPWAKTRRLPECNCGRRAWTFRAPIDEYHCRGCGYRINGHIMARLMDREEAKPDGLA